MHDAITLEKAGKPAALICTDAFVLTAKAIAVVRGAPEYPFAVVPHPVGSLEAEGLMERARQALPQVLQLLLAKR
jgi:hypothetical protein